MLMNRAADQPEPNPLREGLATRPVPQPCAIVIFGATGDLTHRKLIPALFELFRQRRLPTEFSVLGCARRPWSDDDFRNRMAEAMADEVKQHQSAWQQFAACLFYEPVDLQNSAVQGEFPGADFQHSISGRVGDDHGAAVQLNQIVAGG